MAKPYGKTKGKRPAQTTQGPSKKRKLAPTSLRPKGGRKTKEPKKAAASDRDIIPIPIPDHDIHLSDQDFEVLEEYGNAATSFLDNLDQKGISRSKKETDRLHHMNKPVRRAPAVDDLPSIDSHDEDDDDDDPWNSDLDEEHSSLPASDTSSEDDIQDPPSDLDSDIEMPYETVPRKRRPSWDHDQNPTVNRLPIKLPDGRIQKVTLPSLEVTDDTRDEDEDNTNLEERSKTPIVEDISTGARFGHPAVVDVVGNKSRISRIQNAKEEIARICQEIIAEPESSLGLLRRLHTFSLKEISTPTHPDPVSNDPVIRKLAILSQLAVFKDIIPGYRIRALTDTEKAEKVSQSVARTREWEQGLVVVYQSYLRSLEGELKGKTDLAEVSLRCICTLAVEATHFNFSVNLMSCIVARLSKKSWDKSSDLCLKTLIRVFRSDLTGASSLEIVRLLNRMIKERRFNVHPKLLSCLVHLRLKTELGSRTLEPKPKSDKKSYSKGRAATRRARGKATDQPHLSKKARKAMREQKEIDREFRDAEADVDKEERAASQTETLKLLFVLYFRILKNPTPTPLLPAALRGISKYAHLVNIDFFKDLMKVLKGLISHESDEGQVLEHLPKDGSDIQHRLLCILTAFELLSGQGEALNIDLSDFINELYGIILPLSLLPNIEATPDENEDEDDDDGDHFGGEKPQSVVDIVFRALNVAFSPRSFGTSPPPWRSAAFSKRILIASLQWPPGSALRALDFVAGLIAKYPKLEALLGGTGDEGEEDNDRMCDGKYRPDVDDPQLCNPFGTSFWELHMLRQHHWDPRVREKAEKLARFTRS